MFFLPYDICHWIYYGFIGSYYLIFVLPYDIGYMLGDITVRLYHELLCSRIYSQIFLQMILNSFYSTLVPDYNNYYNF